MEYKIVHADGFQSLVYRVNEDIQKGWIPIGGMTVNGMYKYQAMIKKDGK